MRKALFAWIAHHDAGAALGDEAAGTGPIARALLEYDKFDDAVLLSNQNEIEPSVYREWLKKKTGTKIKIIEPGSFDPTDYNSIFPAARNAVDDYLKEHGEDVSLVFHTSPGTPAMMATWIFLGKTRYQDKAVLIQSSKEHGVEELDVPLNMVVEFVPVPVNAEPVDLDKFRSSYPQESGSFKKILRNCKKMERLVTKAQLLAHYDLPVIIVGESGTGKELFAQAIHADSARSIKKKHLVVVNCGAIPSSLIETELFGYKKGSFTDAKKDKAGYFDQADGGTIFLDEVGEMPLEVQVKLLRVLNDGIFYPVGAEEPTKVNVRVIAATNSNLQEAIRARKFREDLLYRLKGSVLNLPPLRQREGDLKLLIDAKLRHANLSLKEQNPEYTEKELLPEAYNELLRYRWPGNVRELEQVILNSAIQTYDRQIKQTTVHEAIHELSLPSSEEILDRPLGAAFDLESTLDEVKKHYLERAYREAKGVKKQAAKLLGDESKYQTFDAWYEKLCK